MGGHDIARIIDRKGEVMIWCRKCSGFARQRMGPKLMNCCKPEQVGTKEYGKRLKRFHVLGRKRIWQDVETNPSPWRGQDPARESRKWKIERQKRRMTRKAYRRLWNEFEMG